MRKKLRSLRQEERQTQPNSEQTNQGEPEKLLLTSIENPFLMLTYEEGEGRKMRLYF